jgi:hypothetical protein
MSDIIAYAFEVMPGKKKEYITTKDIKNFSKNKQGPTLRIKRGKMDEDDLPAKNPKSEFILDLSKDYQGITFKKKFSKGGILKVASKLKKASKAHASQAETLEKIAEMKKGGMPARNKRNFRPTKSGAGMTRAGVKAYRRLNPGSKLKTAVTGDVKAGSKAAKRRKSYCARSLGQLKRASAKTRNDPNSRIRQARRRWKC